MNIEIIEEQIAQCNRLEDMCDDDPGQIVAMYRRYMREIMSTIYQRGREDLLKHLPDEDEQGRYFKETQNLDEVSYGIGWNACREEFLKELKNN